jgi:hypothetical protein
MMVCADNRPCRKYFEGDEGHFRIKDKRNRNKWLDIEYEGGLVQNTDMFKVLISQNITDTNYTLDGGQIYQEHALSYAARVNNTYVATMYPRNDQFGHVYPASHKPSDFNSQLYLHLGCKETISNYGKDSQRLYSAGNSGLVTLQLLSFMGFESIVVVGFCDTGITAGHVDNEPTAAISGVQPGGKKYLDKYEIEGIKATSYFWGDRLKFLAGGDLCAPYINMDEHKLETYSYWNKREYRDIVMRRIKNAAR